jgi:hypothetical protein
MLEVAQKERPAANVLGSSQSTKAATTTLRGWALFQGYMGQEKK